MFLPKSFLWHIYILKQGSNKKDIILFCQSELKNELKKKSKDERENYKSIWNSKKKVTGDTIPIQSTKYEGLANQLPSIVLLSDVSIFIVCKRINAYRILLYILLLLSLLFVFKVKGIHKVIRLRVYVEIVVFVSERVSENDKEPMFSPFTLIKGKCAFCDHIYRTKYYKLRINNMITVYSGYIWLTIGLPPNLRAWSHI